jgi:hypothetical protein
MSLRRMILRSGIGPIGNASNAATASLVLKHVADIEAFSSHPESGFLLLNPGAKP